MLSAMPSRRQSSAIEVSARRLSSTIRIFSSAASCFRVARRMLRTSDDAGVELDFVLSSLLEGYDEPEILRSSSRIFDVFFTTKSHGKGWALRVAPHCTGHSDNCTTQICQAGLHVLKHVRPPSFWIN